MPANKRKFRIPAGVTLRECSIVIIGSTCKICGRDFKCESDVILHKRWRHNTAIGPLIESLNNESYFQDVGQNCDICDAYFVNISDLKIHKRLIHKQRRKKKLRKETVHVTFKLHGVTIMDVNIDRKYLKVQENSRYVVDADTQTPNCFEEHPDDCAANIDLFLPNNSHIEYGIWPQANRLYFDDTTKKHTIRDNRKNESLTADSNVDDDVQEVLRITRGSTQNDINHESPNRTEREILVQNSADVYMLSIQGNSTIYPEKYNAGFTTNVESSNYLPFTTISESSYEFLTNTFNKKLGIYLEDLHHYGIKCYKNLSEINNNLEVYPVYDHQDFLHPWMQAAESQYTNGLRANDNEAIVVLD